MLPHDTLVLALIYALHGNDPNGRVCVEEEVARNAAGTVHTCAHTAGHMMINRCSKSTGAANPHTTCANKIKEERDIWAWGGGGGAEQWQNSGKTVAVAVAAA